MTIKYTVASYRVPAYPDRINYYPRFVSSGQVGPREIAEDIARISTVSPADTFAVLEALLQVLPGYLADGRVVQLGDLGSFRLAIQAQGSEKSENVTPDKIKRCRIHFRPGRLLQKILKTARYQRYNQIPESPQ